MIEVSNIIKTYGNGENKNQVLKGINLQIDDGGFTVILGASGSGKSTLLNVISGLERSDSGRVMYEFPFTTLESDKNKVINASIKPIVIIIKAEFSLANSFIDIDICTIAEKQKAENATKNNRYNMLE